MAKEAKKEESGEDKGNAKPQTELPDTDPSNKILYGFAGMVPLAMLVSYMSQGN